jgi:hypothetical protein
MSHEIPAAFTGFSRLGDHHLLLLLQATDTCTYAHLTEGGMDDPQYLERDQQIWAASEVRIPAMEARLETKKSVWGQQCSGTKCCADIGFV